MCGTSRNEYGLTDQQERFCYEYVIDQNATRAAKVAGYSPKSARAVASRLLTYANVKKKIFTLQQKNLNNLQITAEKVLAEYAKMAFSNLGDYVRVTEDGEVHTDLSDIDRDQFAALSEITTDTYVDGDDKVVKKTKIKLSDKGKSLDSLARHFGLFHWGS